MRPIQEKFYFHPTNTEPGGRIHEDPRTKFNNAIHMLNKRHGTCIEIFDEKLTKFIDATTSISSVPGSTPKVSYDTIANFLEGRATPPQDGASIFNRMFQAGPDSDTKTLLVIVLFKLFVGKYQEGKNQWPDFTTYGNPTLWQLGDQMNWEDAHLPLSMIQESINLTKLTAKDLALTIECADRRYAGRFAEAFFSALHTRQLYSILINLADFLNINKENHSAVATSDKLPQLIGESRELEEGSYLYIEKGRNGTFTLTDEITDGYALIDFKSSTVSIYPTPFAAPPAPGQSIRRTPFPKPLAAGTVKDIIRALSEHVFHCKPRRIDIDEDDRESANTLVFYF